MATTKGRRGTSRVGGTGKEYDELSKRRKISMSMEEFRKTQARKTTKRK